MRILHEIDTGRIDVVIGSRHVRILGGDAIEGALPQVAGEGEHIGLVNQCDVLAWARGCQLECVPHATFHTMCSVHAALRGYFEWRALAQHSSLAGIGTLGVFPNDDELVWCGVARRGPGIGTLIDIEVKFETHLQQQTALDNARGHLGRTDSTNEDRIKGA